MHAVVVVDSWGKFPMSGILEGTVTDFGSFDECLSIPAKEAIGEPQYCTIEMRPLLPPRPRFHNIIHGVRQFHNVSSIISPGKVLHSHHHMLWSALNHSLVSLPPFRDEQINDQLLQYVHFFYYINLRIGICLPSKCSLQEIDSIVNQGKDIHTPFSLFLQLNCYYCRQVSP